METFDDLQNEWVSLGHTLAGVEREIERLKDRADTIVKQRAALSRRVEWRDGIGYVRGAE